MREQDFLISTLCNEGKRGKKALAQKKGYKNKYYLSIVQEDHKKDITERASRGLYAYTQIPKLEG